MLNMSKADLPPSFYRDREEKLSLIFKDQIVQRYGISGILAWMISRNFTVCEVRTSTGFSTNLVHVLQAHVPLIGLGMCRGYRRVRS